MPKLFIAMFCMEKKIKHMLLSTVLVVSPRRDENMHSLNSFSKRSDNLQEVNYLLDDK